MKIKKIKKKAQYTNPKPSSLFEPRGSDLSGRFPSTEFGSGSDFGWGLMAQQDQGIPIEQRLGRQYMSPLPEGLSQESDSYELQLRKYRAGDEVGDPHKNIEELLGMDHDEGVAYLSTEELLEENRPKPLMITISNDENIQDPSVSWYERAEQNKDKMTKESAVVKTSSFFGVFDASSPWGEHNNLDIRPEDRIWSAQEDESEQQDRSSKIRNQFRYNPTYTNGIYFELDNVRGFPYPANNPNNNHMSLHPLERMASDDSSQIHIDGKLSEVFSLLASTKKSLLSGESLSTRFITTEDFFPIIGSIFDDKRIRVDLFETENYLKDTKEIIYSVWVSMVDIPAGNIENLESFLTYGNRNDETDVLVEKLLGNEAVKTKREIAVKKILGEVKNICEQYEIKDVYLIGGVTRDISKGNTLSDIKDLDFIGGWTNQSLKVGGLLAERLGVKEVEILHKTMTMRLEYDCIKIDFKGIYSPVEIREKLREKGIKATPFNMDVYNRDFTINMLVYNILDDKIIDICGESKSDLDQGIIRTFFDPDFVCQENPLVMLRAVKLMVLHYVLHCMTLY